MANDVADVLSGRREGGPIRVEETLDELCCARTAVPGGESPCCRPGGAVTENPAQGVRDLGSFRVG